MKTLPQSLSGPLLWIATLGWAICIWMLSSRPPDDLSTPLFEIPHGDKIAHLVAFAVGGFLLASAIRLTTGLRWGRIFLFSIAGIALFGALDEWHQLYTPGRSGGDVLDWLADFAGAMIGAFSARPIHGRIRQLAGSRTNPEPAAGD